MEYSSSSSQLAHTPILSLTERHQQEWRQLRDSLQATQASAEEIAVCDHQLTRLQEELGRLRA